MDRLRDTNVHITAGSIVTVFLFGILAAVLWYLRDIVLIVLTAIVIASAIEPGIGFLRRYRINRVFSVLLIYLGVALAFFGIIFLFLPPLIDDAINFLTRLPAALQSLSLSQATHGLLPDFSAAFT